MENADVPDSCIQIKATSSEMRDRIMNFMAAKRRQADRRNEFDYFGLNRKHDYCARVEAQVNRRKGESSHLQVRYASNAYGPQTTHATPSKPATSGSCRAFQSTYLINDQPSSSSRAAAVEASSWNFGSSNQESSNQGSLSWNNRYNLESTGKKKVQTLDDIEAEIEKLKKKKKLKDENDQLFQDMKN